MSRLDELRLKTQQKLEKAKIRLNESRAKIDEAKSRSALKADRYPKDTNECQLERPHGDRFEIRSESFGQARGNKRALFIGNDDYPDHPLSQCVNDAQAMRNLFIKFGYQTDLKVNLTVSGMQAAFNRFKATVHPGDEVVISFSGHGIQINSEEYLLATDANDSNFGINLYHELDDLFQTQKPRMVLTLVDACRNQVRIPLVVKKSSSTWLNAQVNGRALVFASSHNQTALEFPGLNHGVFTHCFLEEARRPSPKSIRDLIERVRESVGRLTKNEQIVAFHDELSGDFYFN